MSTNGHGGILPPASAHILVVVEDAGAAESMRAALMRHGFSSPVVASHPGAAIAATEREQVDLLLADVRLGTHDGVETVRAIQTRRCVPALYVADQADAHAWEKARITFAAGFLVRPFSHTQLAAAVGVALGAVSALMKRTHVAQRTLKVFAEALAEIGIVTLRSEDEPEPVPELTLLTPREWDILRALLAHHRVPSIARQMKISVATVRNHLRSIFSKLDVGSQEELLQRVTRRTHHDASV